MSNDDGALKAKQKEISDFTKNAIAPIGSPSPTVVETVLNGFVRLTPPEIPPVEFITISMLSSGPKGRSHKPGNIYLNWRKLIDVMPDTVIAAAGAEASPY